MNSITKDFLLREYDQIWAHLRDVWDTRTKAVALYFAAYGAVAGAGMSLVPGTSCADVKLWMVGPAIFDRLVCLPRYYVVPAATFLVLLSAVVTMLIVRLHILSSEYTTTVNRIRAAFLRNEPRLLRAHLVLPVTPHAPGTWRVDFWIVLAIACLGGSVFAFAVTHASNWPGVRRAIGFCPLVVIRALPVVGFGSWILVWVLYFRGRAAAMAADLGQRPGVLG